jgi:hypothetical protein
LVGRGRKEKDVLEEGESQHLKVLIYALPDLK